MIFIFRVFQIQKKLRGHNRIIHRGMEKPVCHIRTPMLREPIHIHYTLNSNRTLVNRHLPCIYTIIIIIIIHVA